MNRVSSDLSIKNSRTVNTPEQYVTVQIHNQNIKNKYRIHRSSVLNQLRITESRLNQSLNRNTSSHQSNFLRVKRDSTSEKSFKIERSPLFKKKKIITEADSSTDENRQPQYQMSEEISQKFKQISNISYQLQKACEPPKKNLRQYENSIQLKYRLPVVQETMKVDCHLRDTPERAKLRKKWREKIRMGKQYTEHLKKNPILLGILKKAKLNQTLEKQVTEQEKALATPIEIRDAYTQPIRHQRKTAPQSQAHTNFFNMFCSNKPQKGSLYDSRVELEPVSSLQEFAEAGQKSSFTDYSNYFNLKQFMRKKEKLSFLQRIYLCVKEKYSGEFKQMSLDQFSSPNLLSLVYYHENSFNMTEQEKRNMRKKLKFID